MNAICPICDDPAGYAHMTCECECHGIAKRNTKEWDAGFAALREKAALFDWLGARIKSHDWHVAPSSGRDEVVIYDHSRGERIHGATLAEAVTKAMESEENR